jgi:hypothetical protein
MAKRQPKSKSEAKRVEVQEAADPNYNDTKHIRYVTVGSRQVRLMPGQRVTKAGKIVEGKA